MTTTNDGMDERLASLAASFIDEVNWRAKDDRSFWRQRQRHQQRRRPATVLASSGSARKDGEPASERKAGAIGEFPRWLEAGGRSTRS